MAIFWDAHVHIYPNFGLSALLDAAAENFDRAAVRAGGAPGAEIDRVLLLAEAGALDVFGHLSQAAGRNPDAGPADAEWVFSPTREPQSIVAQKGEGPKLYLVAGRQLISAEEIELLALGCGEKFDDRLFSLPELALRVADRGGIPVLPWGVGKWTGRRGRVVQRFLDSPPACFHAFGDNGNRPLFWPMPPLLERARREKRPILSGSDPLPLADQDRRAGSFGGWIHESEGGAAKLDPDRPAAALTAMFRGGGPWGEFGRGAGPIRFLRDQTRMQARKRFSRLA
jgi:hypothetical protein